MPDEIPVPHIDRWERELVRECIAKLARRRAYLEIGGKRGGSLWYFGNAMAEGARLVSVDLVGGPGGDSDSEESLRMVAARLTERGYTAHVILGDSTDAGTQCRVRETLGGAKLDVLLVDGAHDLASVAVDVRVYAPLVEEGGLVVLHDAGACVAKSDLRKWNGDRFVPGIHAVWRDLAYGRRSLLVQQTSGLGVVWV